MRKADVINSQLTWWCYIRLNQAYLRLGCTGAAFDMLQTARSSINRFDSSSEEHTLLYLTEINHLLSNGNLDSAKNRALLLQEYLQKANAAADVTAQIDLSLSKLLKENVRRVSNLQDYKYTNQGQFRAAIRRLLHTPKRQ